MIGLLATGSSGLGWLAVIGRSRVPPPPPMTTAFTGDDSPFARSSSHCFHHRGPAAGGLLPGRPLPPAGSAIASARTPETQLRAWARERPAAHQKRTEPQIAKAQPTILAIWAGVPACAPRKSSGNAYSRQAVAALPRKLT